ncbi:MAG: hypothetical protein ACYTFT_05655, partial [Planctomycetota bacterium]
LTSRGEPDLEFPTPVDVIVRAGFGSLSHWSRAAIETVGSTSTHGLARLLAVMTTLRDCTKV